MKKYRILLWKNGIFSGIIKKIPLKNGHITGVRLPAELPFFNGIFYSEILIYCPFSSWPLNFVHQCIDTCRLIFKEIISYKVILRLWESFT